jgi:Protein of unknown function (DUF3499)
MGEGTKWTGREPAPARSCSVPGCRATAVATLRADPASLRAWLVDLDRQDGDHLCARHAAAVTPSAGWTVHDERSRSHRAEHSVETSRRSRPLAEPHHAGSSLDLRRPDQDHTVDELLDAHSPLLSRAFSKSRDV